MYRYLNGFEKVSVRKATQNMFQVISETGETFWIKKRNRRAFVITVNRIGKPSVSVCSGVGNYPGVGIEVFLDHREPEEGDFPLHWVDPLEFEKGADVFYRYAAPVQELKGNKFHAIGSRILCNFQPLEIIKMNDVIFVPFLEGDIHLPGIPVVEIPPLVIMEDKDSLPRIVAENEFQGRIKIRFQAYIHASLRRSNKTIFALWNGEEWIECEPKIMKKRYGGIGLGLFIGETNTIVPGTLTRGPLFFEGESQLLERLRKRIMTISICRSARRVAK